MVRWRVRIRFAKQGDLRLISHRDLMRVWERLFRRAGIALSMTEGFHPKPRINLPSALGLGIEGLDEVLEVDLAEERPLEQLIEQLRRQSPPGLVVHAAEHIPEGVRKARVVSATFELPVPEERQVAAVQRMSWFFAQTALPIERAGRSAPLDLRPLVEELSLESGLLRMRLRVDREGSARPREVLAVLELADLEALAGPLRRTRVELEC